MIGKLISGVRERDLGRADRRETIQVVRVSDGWSRECEPKNPAGGVPEGDVPDEALRSRCRQLARDLPADRAASFEALGREWLFPYLALLTREGRRWFRVDGDGVALTPMGRAELIGGRAAA